MFDIVQAKASGWWKKPQVRAALERERGFPWFPVVVIQGPCAEMYIPLPETQTHKWVSTASPAQRWKVNDGNVTGPNSTGDVWIPRELLENMEELIPPELRRGSRDVLMPQPSGWVSSQARSHHLQSQDLPPGLCLNSSCFIPFH